MGEVNLTLEAAALANRIREIDSELDDLKNREATSVHAGMLPEYGFQALRLRKAEAELDERRARLTTERSELSAQLKASVTGQST